MTNNQPLHAEIYQALHTGTFGDWQFYKSLVQSKVKSKLDQSRLNDQQKSNEQYIISVLELGCGAGRVLSKLAELDIKLSGLELNEGLLNLCRKNIAAQHLELSLKPRYDTELILGDFSELADCFPSHDNNPHRQFDLIILPYNGLYCLLSEEAQTKLIKEALNLLNPEGELWFDGYALPDPDEYDYESSAKYSPLTVIELAPSSLRKDRFLGVEELDHFHQKEQRFTAHYRFKAPDDEVDLEPLHGRIEQVEHRYIYPWQLPSLCQNAGGRLQQVTADFGGVVVSSEQNIRTALEWGIEAEHWVACVKNLTEIS